MAIDTRSREVLAECARSREPVYFSGDGIDVVFQTQVIETRKDELILANTVKPEYISRVCSSKQYFLQCHMVRFRTERLATDGEHIIFPLQDTTILEETRQSERFPFSAEEQVICELVNPFDNETRLAKTVMDMSATGLSIRTAFESELLASGTVFREIRVLIDGETYTQCPAKVVYHRKLLDAKGQLRLQIGLKFLKSDQNGHLVSAVPEPASR